jgi:hypothetical protein
MVIIEILWHVRKGKEPAFLEAWRTKFTVSDRSKLVGEFLCRPNDQVEERYKTWRVADFNEPSEDVMPFVNVALWDSIEGFQEEISKYIPAPGASKPDFEIARYRIVLEPTAWRIGGSELPHNDSLGTR